MKDVYTHDIENHMRQFYESLNEKDRWRYATIEACKVGQGGVAYVAELFGCHPDMITQGKRDLEELPADEAAGGVRKRARPGKCLQKPTGRRRGEKS